MQSWAAPGLLHAGRRLCLPQARPRAHHHGIRETQARLDGKSVLNFWPASGSHGQVHGGGGLQAVQPAQLLGPGPQHPPSLAPGGEGGLGWLRPRLCDFGVGAPGVPSSPWPLAWRMGATPVPGGLGTNEAMCEAGPQRVLKQERSARGEGPCGSQRILERQVPLAEGHGEGVPRSPRPCPTHLRPLFSPHPR